MPQKKLSRSRSASIASVEGRDKVYQRLIKLSPLIATHKLNYGKKWLSKQSQDVEGYGILPKSAIARHGLIQLLIESLVKEDRAIPPFRGVPGFWRDSNGRPRLGSDFDYDDDLLLIPFLDSTGLIQACQIKAVGKTTNNSGKYQWLSSIGKREGCSSGTPLHHEGFKGSGGKIETVLVTEGVLKAAAAQHFLPDRYVVGNSGVATSHQEIVKTARRKDLEIAFDADCFTNPHVARAQAALISLRIREQRFLSDNHPTRILTWDNRFKGIDDALIAGATLKFLNVSEWLSALTPACLDVVSHQLGGLSITK